MLAVKNDEELNKLFKNVTIAQGMSIIDLSLAKFSVHYVLVMHAGGVLPNIHAVLLPKQPKGTATAVEVSKPKKKSSKKATAAAASTTTTKEATSENV